MKTTKLTKSILKSALATLSNDEYIDLYRQALYDCKSDEEIELVSSHRKIYYVWSDNLDGATYMSEENLMKYIRSLEDSLVDLMIENDTDFGLSEKRPLVLQAA